MDEDIKVIDVINFTSTQHDHQDMLTDSGYDFRVLFENKTVGIIISDNSGRIIEANVYAGILFGYTPCELRELSVDDLVPKELKHAHHQHRDDYNLKPRTRIMGAGIELKGQRKDGSTFPIEISLSPFEKDGQNMVIAFIMDATIRRENELKIKRQNEELNSIKLLLEVLNAELEEKVSDRTKILQETLYELESSRNELSEALEKEKELGELKSRFVSMASHEFRTPLSTILSSAALMSRYLEKGEIDKCHKHINRIKSGVDHLNAVLEDFLSLGKIEDGRVQFQPETFLLEDRLQQLASEMQEIAKPHQTINVDCDPSFEIFTDKAILRNALINLISNAIKFSEEGCSVDIKAEKVNGFYKISITDHGMGIPEEEQKYLFDRFFRASNVSNIQGTGLGLYIVKSYIEMMNGNISYISEQGKGTTFTIHLPA